MQQVKNIVDNVKDIMDLVRQYNNQDLYERIVELREQAFELREENLSLKEQLNTLKRNDEIAGQLVRPPDANYYERRLPDGTILGPFCLACWDYEGKLVNMIKGSYYTSGAQNKSVKHSTIKCKICEARKLSHKQA